MIAQRLKREPPLAPTIMITDCNRYNSYIPDDAPYDQVGHEVMNASVKRGCAEGAIVNGLIE